MTGSAPLPVAVVIPAHDHAEFLGEAIESVLAQRPPPAELVVVDDGSSDGSAAVAASALRHAGETRTTLIEQPNAGAATAMNRAVAATRSPWLAFLNDDDVYLPGRLRTMLRALEEAGRQVAISGVEFRGEPGADELHRFLEGYPPGLAEIARLPTFGFGLFAFNLEVTSSNLVISRSHFEAVGGFDPSLPLSHDLEILWQSLRLTEPLLVPEVLLRYRVHRGNTYPRLRPRAASEYAIRVQRFASWAGGNGPAILNPLAPCPACWPRYFPAFARVVRPWPSERPLCESLPSALGTPAPPGAVPASIAELETAALRNLFVPMPEVLDTVPSLERLHASWLGQGRWNL